MAFCSKCGTELSDGAKFCPKCGEEVNQQSKSNDNDQPKSLWDSFKEGWKEGVAENNNESDKTIEQDNSNKGLSKAKKIGLGWAGAVAVLSLFMGIGEGNVELIIVTLLGIAVIACTYFGLIKPIYTWFIAIGVPLCLLFLIGNADKHKNAETQSSSIEQKQESPAEKAEREKKEQADQEANEKQEKIKKVAEMAYKLGYETRKKTWGETLSSRAAAEADYRFRYAKDPEDEGQSERWKVFLENYQKGFSDCANDIIKKFKQEDF